MKKYFYLLLSVWFGIVSNALSQECGRNVRTTLFQTNFAPKAGVSADHYGLNDIAITQYQEQGITSTLTAGVNMTFATAKNQVGTMAGTPAAPYYYGAVRNPQDAVASYSGSGSMIIFPNAANNQVLLTLTVSGLPASSNYSYTVNGYIVNTTATCSGGASRTLLTATATNNATTVSTTANNSCSTIFGGNRSFSMTNTHTTTAAGTLTLTISVPASRMAEANVMGITGITVSGCVPLQPGEIYTCNISSGTASASCPSLLVGSTDFHSNNITQTGIYPLSSVVTNGPSMFLSTGLTLAATNANVGAAGFYAVVNNPNTFNTNYPVINSPMYVVRWDQNRTLLNISSTGLLPAGNYEAVIEGFVLDMPASRPSNWGTNFVWTDSRGNNTLGGSFCNVLDKGDKFSYTGKTTLNANIDGSVTLSLRTPTTFSNYMVLGITKIEIRACLDVKIISSQGEEVCQGERIRLSLNKDYGDNTYAWEKYVGATVPGGATWTPVGGNSQSVLDEINVPTVWYRCRINGSATTNFKVTSIPCCSDDAGNATSRKEIFYDNFGTFLPNNLYMDVNGNIRPVTDCTGAQGNPNNMRVKSFYDVEFPALLAFNCKTGCDGTNGRGYAITNHNNLCCWIGGYTAAMPTCGTNNLNNNTLLRTDATGDPLGGILSIDLPNGLDNGAAFFSKQINDICPGKTFYFSIYYAPGSPNTQSGASAAIIRLVMEDPGGNVLNEVIKNGKPGYGQITQGWQPISMQFTVPKTATYTSVRFKIYSESGHVGTADDHLLDEFKIMVCSPPHVDAFLNVKTLMQDSIICGGGTFNMGTSPSTLLKQYYGAANVRYLHQHSTDGITWENISGVTADSTYFVDMNDFPGDKNYFRVVVATNAALQDFVTDPGYENFEDNCRNSSVSKPFVITRVADLGIGDLQTITKCFDTPQSVSMAGTANWSLVSEWEWKTADGTVLVARTSDPVNRNLTHTFSAPTTVHFIVYSNNGVCSDIQRFTLVNQCDVVTCVPAVSISGSPVSPVCAGTSVTFTATPTNGGSTPSYQWRVNGGNVGANSNTHTYTPANGDVITCVLTSNATCASPTTATSNAITMVVNPTLVPAVSINGSPVSPVCAGTSVTFTATPTNGGSTPTYQWQVNGGNVGTGTTYSYTPANGDVITCILTSNADCASPTTATSNAVTMVVNPTLVPAVSISESPASPVCSGTSVTFTATPTNGGSTPTYQWQVNGGNVGTGTTYSYTPTNGDVITCILTSNADCASPTTATSNTVTMVVNPTLVPAVSISESPASPVCSGTSVTFTATPTNGGSTPTYQWQVNGSNVGTGTTYSYTPANGDVITCVLTSNEDCASPTTATSNAVTMTVNSTIVPEVTISSSPASPVCAGTSVTFTASPSGGGSTPTYQWQVNGGNVGTGVTYSYTPANGDVIICIMTSNSDCASPTTATSNTVTMTVNSTLVPAVAISGSPASPVCAGTSVTFTATPTNGGSTPTYQWQVNGGNVGTGTTYSYTPANGDVITCILTSNEDCATPTTATSNAVTMVVNPTLVPAISISESPASPVCSGTSVTFTATPTNGGSTPTYQWQVNGGNVGTGTTYSYAPANGDVITCVLTSNADCATPTTATSNAVTMAVNTTIIPEVSISSNPTSPVCASTSVTFTASPSGGGSAPTYQWKVNGGDVGTGGNTYSYIPNNDDEITCVMTSNSDCASPTTATSNTVTMTVNSALVPAVSISGSPASPVCSGTSVTFTATPTNGGSTPTYQWQVNGGNVGTGTTYSYTPANDDVITCILTSNEDCASPTTATSNTVTMVVNPTLVPAVSISESPASPVCSGTSVTFTATPTNGGSTPTYQWQVNGGNVGTGTTYSYTPANDDVITCILTSNEDCASPTTATSNAVTMAVNTTIIPEVSISSNPTSPVCAGTSVTFTASPSGGGSAPTYQWKVNGGDVGTGGNTYSYIPNNGDEITCVMTSNSDCASPTTATSNTVTMTVNSALVPAVAISGSPASPVCAGTNVTFTATPTNGGSTPTYQWQVNGDNVGAGTTYSYTPANGDVITCILTSNEDCASPTTATSNAVTMVVNPTLVPVVSISESPASPVCAGTSVTFTATPTNGGSTPTYQWRVNGGNVGTGTTYSYTPANDDVITCILTSNEDCATPTTATSNAVTMTVANNLTPSVSIGTANTTVCEGTQVTFSVTDSQNGGTNPAYQWQVNGNNTGTGATTFSYTPNNNDVITVIMTSDLICVNNPTATSNAVTMTVTGNLTPSVSISATNTTMCEDTQVTFSVTDSQNGGMNPTYQWQVNGSNAGTGATTFNYTPNNNDIITVIMTSDLVCVTSATATSNPIMLTITGKVTPIFTVTPTTYCEGATIPALPTISDNGITGTWLPAINNLADTEYTFTPNAGECANTATLTITITNKVTPTFNIAQTYCEGATISALPTTSDNGITGTWSPAINNLADTEYTFTPNIGECANTATLTITITNKVTPTFNIAQTYCEGATISALPTTSNNGITGTWSPAINNLADTEYTFTPNIGECANTATLTITIQERPNVSFVALSPVCGNGSESIELSLLTAIPAGTTVEWYDSDKTTLIQSGGDKLRVYPVYKNGFNHRSVHTYYVKTVHGICEAQYFPVYVNVDEPLIGNIETSSPQACEGSNITINAGSYYADTYIWTSSAFDGEKTTASITELFDVTTKYYLEMLRGVCTGYDEVTIEVNSKPVILSIDSVGIRDREIIFDPSYGTPPFKYGINDDPVDNNPVKYNLLYSMHTFYIVDAAGCYSVAYQYPVNAPKLLIPSYFTPNGDGINDTWDILGINEMYPDAVITIYDRFGKELVKYRGTDEGWDGKYLGRDMPTTDYWYVIDIKEINKQYTGHFTLLRR